MTPMAPRVHDRRQAWRILVKPLEDYRGRPNLLVLVLVLELPRDGAPVAFEVVHALRALLDIFVVRKIGSPGHEE